MNITKEAIHICNVISEALKTKMQWIHTHPTEVTDRISAVGTALSPIATLIQVKVTLDQQNDELLHYKDPTTNVTYELKRPLNNIEGKEIANLVRTKERPVEDYLEELNILK